MKRWAVATLMGTAAGNGQWTTGYLCQTIQKAANVAEALGKHLLQAWETRQDHTTVLLATTVEMAE